MSQGINLQSCCYLSFTTKAQHTQMLLQGLNFKCTAEAFTTVGDSMVQLNKYTKLCNKNCEAKNASEVNSKSKYVPSTNEFGLISGRSTVTSVTGIFLQH
jgi:hypothetical protein